MAEFKAHGILQEVALQVRAALGRVEVLSLFPLIALTATWVGFDDLALVTAIGLSILLAISGLAARTNEPGASPKPSVADGRGALVAMLDRVSGLAGRDTACILLQVDEWPVLLDRMGHDACEELALRLQDRLQSALRNGDLLARLGDSRFGIVLSPLASARLGLRDAISSRLSQAISEPLPMRGTTVRLSASLGHSSMIRRGADPAGITFRAAEAALAEAALNGPGAIRAYAPGMGRARALQSSLSEEVEAAIHDGAITAWFQPQIHARTGALSGMETLARWQHPKHGLLGPREFLPAVEASGHLPLLGRTVFHRALKALRDWDAMQAHVPSISINFSAGELRDPGLAANLADEIARHGLAPERIVIVILEDVATTVEEDAVFASLRTIRDAGHRLDLEGFGRGAASIPMLQRLGVTRVRIDRSFVLDTDIDHGKRQAVSAIIAMAKAMEVETLACGVETPNEKHAMSDLGCDHLQGFGIARPMGYGHVADWARAQGAVGRPIHLDDRRA